MLSRKITQVVAILCVTALAACTTVEPPTSLATQARESVQRAEGMGADKAAPLALREANQYLERAEQAMNRDNNEEAYHFLEKSLINSELAIARTNAERSQKAAQQIEENLDALKNQALENQEAGSDTFE